METLAQFTSELEYYSIDEAFIVCDDYPIEDYGKKIRATVLYNTGIPVTIGAAETKTLAKIAVEYAKKKNLRAGIFDLSSYHKREEILAEILVQEVWGIGVKHAEWLYQRGINTAAQLRDIGDELIRKRAGVVGLRTVYELRGMRCFPLQRYRPPRKNVTSSCSFGRYVTSLKELKEAVATYAANTGAKLRRDGSVAGLLSVYITTNVYSKKPQYAKTAIVALIPPTDCDHELIKVTLHALERIYKPGYRYIKAGVILSQLTPASQQQLHFFAKRDYTQCERLYSAVDDINLDYGLGTIFSASAGVHKPWAMRQDFRSLRFTTRWEELPVANK
jgi:DNA polymerase V